MSHDTETAADALDDAVIEEGDEHRIQISGAPMASMMCPESFREIICVAPAEGEKPILIFKPCLTLTSSHMVLVHRAVNDHGSQHTESISINGY